MLPKLNVKIGADTKELDRELSKTQIKLRKFAKIAAVAAGAAAVAMGAMVRAGLANIDAQAKLAQSLNTTVKSMQVMERAGELAGVSMQGIEQATKDLTRRLSQAASGTGPAIDALNRLGLSAKSLSEIPLDKRIEVINDAIAEFIPAAEQAAVAGMLFGEEGSIAMSRISGETIRQAARDIRDFGVAISEVDAEQIERTNDAVSRLGLIWKGLVTRLTVNVAPALEFIADKLAELWKDMRVVGVALSHLGKIFSEVFGRMGNSGTILVNKMKLVWGTINRGFLSMILGIQGKWTSFIRGMAIGLEDIPFMGVIGQKLHEAASKAGNAYLDTALTIGGLIDSTAALTTENERLAAANKAPLKSVRDMLLAVKELTADLYEGSISSEEFAESLAGINEKAKEGTKDGLTVMQEKLKSIADTMSTAMTSGFISMIDGTKSVTDAFRDMAKSIIAKLYEVLVIQQIVGSFNASTGAGTGLVGMLMKGFSSFEGGGFTGNGPRTGGLDGKGGQLAIVHPRETIIDHTKPSGQQMGGGGTVIVNQSINVTTGVQATVRAEIVSLMPRISESAKLAVLDARKRGGAFAGAF